ncbi:MAG: FixH family protein [Cellvibrionaceae bacterium]
MNTLTANEKNLPWYKVTWFWIIISPLILVVFACAVTITIAFKNSDDVVIGNYYKEGLLINDTKDRQQLAATMGLSGEMFFDLALGEVTVVFEASDKEQTMPSTLRLTLSHPANEEKDFSMTLQKKLPGESYFSELPKRLSHKWYWSITSISDADSEKNKISNNWLLKGDVDFEQSATSHF